MKSIGVLLLLCLAASAEENTNKLRLTERAEPAGPGEFPFLVSIQIHGQHTCGGALITKTHVLTAAHCVVGLVSQRNPSAVRAMTVEVGSTRIGGGTSHAVKRIAMKSDFMNTDAPSGVVIANDVAVITLKTPITESSNVGTISMGSSNPPAGSTVSVAGYGNARIGGPTSSTLLKTQLKTISNSECSSFYMNMMARRVTQDHVCAKLAPGYGVCQGDSGGPLIYNNQVIAVVSAGDGHCGAGHPDVFTLISRYQSWIQRAISASPGGSDESSVDGDGGSPGYPGQPPQIPGYPGQPPKIPGYPGQPGQPPQIPGYPPYPGQPGQPPQIPGYPPYPGQPGQPGRPQIPGYPPYPGYPGQPGKPQVPGQQPGIPGTPGFPAPGQPGYPMPGQPGYPGGQSPDVYPWDPQSGNPYPQPPPLQPTIVF